MKAGRLLDYLEGGGTGEEDWGVPLAWSAFQSMGVPALVSLVTGAAKVCDTLIPNPPFLVRFPLRKRPTTRYGLYRTASLGHKIMCAKSSFAY